MSAAESSAVSVAVSAAMSVAVKNHIHEDSQWPEITFK